MFNLKCFKKRLFKLKLLKLMKSENIRVREYCSKRDWEGAGKWLHINKATFKAYRRMEKL